MRKSFVNVKQPMIAGVIKENTPRTAIAEIKNSIYQGASGIDLHLSCLAEQYRTEEHIHSIINASKLPVLALNYNVSYEDASIYEATEEERTNLLMMAIDAGAAAADIQGYTFDLTSKKGFREEFSNLNYSFIKGNPKEIVVDSKIIDKQMDFIEKVHHKGAELLLSTHPGIPMDCQQVVDLALFLEKRNPDIIKIVTVANTEEEMVEAFKTMITLKKEVKTPVSYHCSGLKGDLTRIVNPMLGGFMCFCNPRFQHNSDMHQPLIATAKTLFDNLEKIL